VLTTALSQAFFWLPDKRGKSLLLLLFSGYLIEPARLSVSKPGVLAMKYIPIIIFGIPDLYFGFVYGF